MRWIPFLLLAYVATVVQITLGAVLSVPVGASVLRVDFLAALAAALALRVRNATDAVLAGWTLGLVLDLVSPVSTPTGLYAMCFGVGAWVVYHVREAVFGENPLTQVMMGLVLCLVAHGLARIFINVYVRDVSHLGRDLLTAVLVSLCTAAITPLVCRVIGRVAAWVLVQPVARRRR